MKINGEEVKFDKKLNSEIKKINGYNLKCSPPKRTPKYKIEVLEGEKTEVYEIWDKDGDYLFQTKEMYTEVKEKKSEELEKALGKFENMKYVNEKERLEFGGCGS